MTGGKDGARARWKDRVATGLILALLALIVASAAWGGWELGRGR
ncbi:MAG: hypothetical protein JWO25_2242 [Alphaproteobacteria bacterium]|nr:hypothetical protein [Alphaproteobacteria bacterium]